MGREIKFRAWDEDQKCYKDIDYAFFFSDNEMMIYEDYIVMQYTGLKDKNGSGMTEVYEGDLISIDGTLKGNIYENNKEPTDIVIPQLGTKAWTNAYKEAMVRGYDYTE